MTPEGWAKRSIQSLLSDDTPGFWGDTPTGETDVPVVRSTNLRDDGRLELDDIAYRSIPHAKAASKALEQGDILLERSGGGPNKPVGRVAYFHGRSGFCFSNFMQRLRPNRQATEPQFLAYALWYLHACGVTNQLQQATTGIRNLNYQQYLDWALDVPPLPEQKKIAEILGSVDQAIQATQAVIDQTRKVKQGLLQQLLTRGIGHTRFKQTEIGEIPDSWEARALGDLAARDRSSFCNGPFGSDLLTSELRTSGVPVIYIRDIRNGQYEPHDQVFVDASKAEALDASRVESGDLLMTKVGDPPVVAALYPVDRPRGIVTQDVIRLRPDTALIDAGFLRLLINSKYGLDLIEPIAIRGTRKRVALGQLKALKIPVPPLQEQLSLRQEIDAFEEVEEESRRSCEHARQLKRGLMQDLLTGRVRVRVND